MALSDPKSESMKDTPLPLQGIRVLELGYYLQTPVCTRILSDFGAEIIKIEEPGIGDPVHGIVEWGGVPTDLDNGRNWLNEHHNMNKKSVTVNLKSEQGRGIIQRLVKKSDVFCTNLRLGALDRLSLNYQALSKYNPKLVYATASGYGKKGPDTERIGYDFLVRAKCGHMDSECEPGPGPGGQLHCAVRFPGCPPDGVRRSAGLTGPGRPRHRAGA